MTCHDAISSLNRLHYLMLRSFPAYSVAIRPVTFRGPEAMHVLLTRIAEEQRLLADRIAEAIREQNAAVEPGQFPIEFTSWNDVALPRIVERSIELLRHVTAEARAIADRDSGAPVYHFAREVLNLTQRHVESLEKALGAKAETA
jgi:hypothetical protein